MSLTRFQITAKGVYDDGAFSYIENTENILYAGDTLFAFLIQELGEDVEHTDEALLRVRFAIDQLEAVHKALASDP